MGMGLKCGNTFRRRGADIDALIEGIPDAVVTRFIYENVRKWPGVDHGRNSVRVAAAMHSITSMLRETKVDLDGALVLARSMSDLKNEHGEKLETLPIED